MLTLRDSRKSITKIRASDTNIWTNHMKAISQLIIFVGFSFLHAKNNANDSLHKRQIMNRTEFRWILLIIPLSRLCQFYSQHKHTHTRAIVDSYCRIHFNLSAKIDLRRGDVWIRKIRKMYVNNETRVHRSVDMKTYLVLGQSNGFLVLKVRKVSCKNFVPWLKS